MKKASVYTKTGDKGVTGLVGGTRIKKSDLRIHLYGEVDELNSSIGVGIAFLEGDTLEKNYLYKLQNILFDIGSNLACEKEKREQFKIPQTTDEMISDLETEIDRMDYELSELRFFILPGGSKEAAFFHLSRTICRRVERQMVDFEDHMPGEVPTNVSKFMNRLSDYFFILFFVNARTNFKKFCIT
jgi:cob(I)alamin adenosyltransferase